MLESAFMPLPALQPSALYSFHPYPVSSRSRTHQTILHPQDGDAGPSTTRRRGLDRAARRALTGKRPAGTHLGREAEDLSAEENELENEKEAINKFGNRFLLPYGRRQTHMEMDAARSPTPSEADHERRQEDQNVGSPTTPLVGTAGEEELEEGQSEEAEADLDASVEDMDASGVEEGHETSMEEE
ncbi:hypothetical protein P7C73_g1755, partial [Tremellales sp. Uapishka_1]